MNGKLNFIVAFIVVVFVTQQVSSSILRDSEDGVIKPEKTVPVVPAFDRGQGLDEIYSDDVTTKRPEISDIIGGGFQNILQGLVKAPGQIATRVQGILDGILRRPTTAPVKPILE